MTLKPASYCVVKNLKNTNFRQALSEELLKVAIICNDTSTLSFLTLIYSIIHHAVLGFSPHLNKPLMRLAHTDVVLFFSNWYAHQVILRVLIG